jgi:arabinose-5-phosphate isomerase
MTRQEIVERGRRVLRLETEALGEAERRIGDEFARAVECIARSEGRVIVSGVGKSGLVGRKIAATLTSTGTPATFLHPADSVHGDLGIVGESDVAILISKSGESAEVLGLLDHLKRLGVSTIALTGNAKSTLARHSDVALDGWVKEEACPHDFARLHPGGSIGKRLLTRVSDVMITDDLPVLPQSATMREAVVQLAERRGIAVITGKDGTVAGVITTGDLSRLMEREENVFPIPVIKVMNAKPKVAQADELGSSVVYRMETHGIIAMPVLDGQNRIVGVIHLHDLMRAGVV